MSLNWKTIKVDLFPLVFVLETAICRNDFNLIRSLCSQISSAYPEELDEVKYELV